MKTLINQSEEECWLQKSLLEILQMDKKKKVITYTGGLAYTKRNNSEHFRSLISKYSKTYFKKFWEKVKLLIQISTFLPYCWLQIMKHSKPKRKQSQHNLTKLLGKH